MNVNKPLYFFIQYILFLGLSVNINIIPLMPSTRESFFYFFIIPFVGGYFLNEEKIRDVLDFIIYAMIYTITIPMILETIHISFSDVTVPISFSYWFIAPFNFYLGGISKNYKMLIIIYPLILFILSLTAKHNISVMFGTIFNASIVISWIWRKIKKE